MEAERIRAEPRWPMALAVLAAIALQLGTPHHGQLAWWWVFPILEVTLLIVMIARDPGRIDTRTRAARRVTVTLIVVLTGGVLFSAGRLIYEILDGQHLTAGVLLGRGAAVWLANVIVFSLWYWEFDRGGPVARAYGEDVPASFAFPENATPELVPNAETWAPQYPDYLYLAFTNSTAFSPTDTLPVRTWAKMTMLLQSMVSLAIAILVIARAINVL
jgi:uncharacterized membrane protein